MPKLTLIRGLPGSGKSTMAKEMMANNSADCHFEADMYHINGQLVYEFRPERIKDSHAWCQRVTAAALKFGSNVVVSNTFTQRWEMEPYLAMGYETEILTARGNYDNVHGVPDEVINRMRERWEE